MYQTLHLLLALSLDAHAKEGIDVLQFLSSTDGGEHLVVGLELVSDSSLEISFSASRAFPDVRFITFSRAMFAALSFVGRRVLSCKRRVFLKNDNR